MTSPHGDALEALRSIEWVYTYGFADKNCPACKNIEAEGHKADCATEAALTATPLGKPAEPVCECRKIAYTGHSKSCPEFQQAESK